MKHTNPAIAAILAVALALAGLSIRCGGGGSSNSPPPPPAVSVSVSPSSPQSVNLSQTVQFTATVSNASNTDVTWSITGAGTISASGLYTAPDDLPSNAAVTVTAKSQADTSKSASGSVTITSNEAVSSLSAPALSTNTGGQIQFAATVTGSSNDTSVTWSAVSGAITAAGLYTAPSSVPSGGTDEVTATSKADPSQSKSATVTVTALGTSLVITEMEGSTPVTVGGAIVLIDGIPVGAIDTTGSFTAPVSPGSRTVTVLDPGGARGDLNVTAVAGIATPAAVHMMDSEAVFAPGSSQIPQIANDAFDYTDNTKNPISVQFLDGSSHPVVVSQLNSAYLSTAMQKFVDLSSYTTVTGSGTLSIDLISALKTLAADGPTIATKGPFLIEVDIQDASGVPYLAAEPFELGIYRITGTVSAPPSDPSLPVAGLQLTFKKHSSKVSFQVTSGSNGSFSLTGVPTGQYDVQGSVTSGGMTYNAFGTALIQANVTVSVVPLSPADFAHNVVSVTTTATSGSALSLERPAPRNVIRSGPRHRRKAIAPAQVYTFPSSSPYGPLLSVTAADKDVPVMQIGIYTIPKGTQSVAIFYQACTEEYPTYVTEQSQYNDLWSILAYDSKGNDLVRESHNVNEELTAEPVWQSDGCTQVQEVWVDVTLAAATSDTTITVGISATNIGDSLLPTSVYAIVAPWSNTLRIKSIDMDYYPFIKSSRCDSQVSNDTRNIAVCESASLGDYISIPPFGSGNTFERPVTAILQFPADSPVTVTNVEFDVVDLNGNVLDTIFNEPPGDNVQLAAPDTLKFSMTYPSLDTPSSTLVNAHPERVNYALTVQGTQLGLKVSAGPTYLGIFNTLWSAVDGGVTVPRYSIRDLGGDDWADQLTITWLKANSNLVTRFNDISGEHGRNIGHQTHGKGTDIDIFHFNPLSTISGLDDYSQVEKTAKQAANGDDKIALPALVSFIEENRDGIDDLNEDPNVLSTRFGIGNASGILKVGWLKQAMLSGTLPLTNGKSKDLGIGAWNPSKTPAFDKGHNSHIHVALYFGQ